MTRGTRVKYFLGYKSGTGMGAVKIACGIISTLVSILVTMVSIHVFSRTDKKSPFSDFPECLKQFFTFKRFKCNVPHCKTEEDYTKTIQFVFQVASGKPPDKAPENACSKCIYQCAKDNANDNDAHIKCTKNVCGFTEEFKNSMKPSSAPA